MRFRSEDQESQHRPCKRSLQDELLELSFATEVPWHLEGCATAYAICLFHDPWPPTGELDRFLPEVVASPALVEKEYLQARALQCFSLQSLVKPVVCYHNPISVFG